jgi:uncharacterized protein (DUF4415 family)
MISFSNVKCQKRFGPGILRAASRPALARMADEKIDLTDGPAVRDWRGAVVGKFYRPIRRPVTIRVDADVVAWPKRQRRSYQARINKLLREAMEGQRRGAQVALGKNHVIERASKLAQCVPHFITQSVQFSFRKRSNWPRLDCRAGHLRPNLVLWLSRIDFLN